MGDQSRSRTGGLDLGQGRPRRSPGSTGLGRLRTCVIAIPQWNSSTRLRSGGSVEDEALARYQHLTPYASRFDSDVDRTERGRKTPKDLLRSKK